MSKKYTVLDMIQSPEDIRPLSALAQKELCSSVRAFMLDHISNTGGHLASNLGVVELTVALHKVFDTKSDRVVFDVGHQCYVHKIFTGRKDRFSTLRTFGGLSGFPKPKESIHDAFIAGHASNSVSVALGMAHSRSLLGKDYHVLAVIGDGALTGGMAYEALNNAGSSREPLIVILNDNNMSITENVGAMSKHLAALRVKPAYLNAKSRVKSALSHVPLGTSVSEMITTAKFGVKSALLPSSLFEKMGITYLGPVDGHDIKSLTEILELAKGMKKPCLVHVLTQKGKGYQFAQKNPGDFHGVSKFNLQTGKSIGEKKESFSDVFGKELLDIAKEDERVCAITAAMQSGTGLVPFAATLPKRFFDVGIAEEHAVSMAAGMAKQGLKPVFAVYSTFLQRSFDQLIHDVAIEQLPVVFAVDRAGIVGEDGETHNGVFDVGFIRQVPGFTLLAPANFAELRSMLRKTLREHQGPTAIRFPRGGQGLFTEDTSEYIGKILQNGDKITVVSHGIMINSVILAAQQLGDDVEIIKLNQLTGDFLPMVLASLKKTGRLLVVEDSTSAAAMDTAILAAAATEGIPLSFAKALNTGDGFLPHGSVEKLRALCGIDAEGVKQSILEGLNVGK